MDILRCQNLSTCFGYEWWASSGHNKINWRGSIYKCSF